MELKFDEKGLIPAIVQDHYTKEVLTLAYMNAETLALTIAEGRTVFWSRSRQEIWRKGETSGNVQRVVSITADCDKDALVVELPCWTPSWAQAGTEQPLSVKRQPGKIRRFSRVAIKNDYSAENAQSARSGHFQ